MIEYTCPFCETVKSVETLEELSFCICGRNAWERKDYFHHKKFISKKLAEALLKKYHLLTPDILKVTYLYDAEKGYYKEAKKRLRQDITRELSHDYTINRDTETLAFIENETFIDGIDEPEPTKINLANGVYDLNKDEVTEHNPSNFFLSALPVAYDKEATCQTINAFLREITDNERDALALEEFAGYCLYRDYPKHRSFLLVGEGANGKSTFLNLLSELLGNENIANVTLQELLTRPFIRAKIHGKLANIFADLPSKALTGEGSGIFKALTGNDMISAERKFVQGTIEFRNYAKFAFSCNQIPRTNDDTDAFWRRWTLIRFQKQFKGKNCDPYLLDKLKKELPGFLIVAINGLNRLKNNNWEFSNERKEQETRVEYLKNSDSLKFFIETRVELTNNADDIITKDVFYAAYGEYVKNEKLGSPEPKNEVSKRIFELLPTVQTTRPRTTDGTRSMAWLGIKLTDFCPTQNLPHSAVFEKSGGLSDFDEKNQNQEVLDDTLDHPDQTAKTVDFGQGGQGGQGIFLFKRAETKIEKEKEVGFNPDHPDHPDQSKVSNIRADRQWGISPLHSAFSLK